MRKSHLYDYSDAYILVKGTITITAPGPEILQQDKYIKEINI